MQNSDKYFLTDISNLFQYDIKSIQEGKLTQRGLKRDYFACSHFPRRIFVVIQKRSN